MFLYLIGQLRWFVWGWGQQHGGNGDDRWLWVSTEGMVRLAGVAPQPQHPALLRQPVTDACMVRIHPCLVNEHFLFPLSSMMKSVDMDLFFAGVTSGVQKAIRTATTRPSRSKKKGTQVKDQTTRWCEWWRRQSRGWAIKAWMCRYSTLLSSRSTEKTGIPPFTGSFGTISVKNELRTLVDTRTARIGVFLGSLTYGMSSYMPSLFPKNRCRFFAWRKETAGSNIEGCLIVVSSPPPPLPFFGVKIGGRTFC